MIYKYVTN